MILAAPTKFQKTGGVLLAFAGILATLWLLLGRSEFEDILIRLGDSGSMDKHARSRLLDNLDQFFEPLAEALQDPQRPIPMRSGIAQVLGESRDPRAVKPLAATLDDPNRFLREAAVHALGALSLPESIPHLTRALSDPHPSVQHSGVNSLIRLTERRGQESGKTAFQILRKFRKTLAPEDPLCLPIDQALSP